MNNSSSGKVAGNLTTLTMSEYKSGDCTSSSVLCGTPSTSKENCIVINDDSDEEFRPLAKFRTPGKTKPFRKRDWKQISIEYEDDSPASTKSPVAAVKKPSVDPESTCSITRSEENAGSQSCSSCACTKGSNKVTPRRVPKIFFGTRTHKQVAQIVRELRKTAYHDVSMTILASREHTCINPQIASSVNKNEGCKDLLKDVGCRFKDRVMKYQSQQAIKYLGLSTAWDLEDLVNLMKAKKACPYFLSRGLKDQADLIICPYNYLVDPLIREGMEISLKGQIVLLDEAHNIEDSAREAASQSITQEQIQRALQDMDTLMDNGIRIADISKLRQMCFKLDSFISNNGSSLTHCDFDQSYRLWSGFDIIAQLQHVDLGPQNFQNLKSTLASIKAEETEERANPDGQQRALSSATAGLLEQLFLALHYLYTDNMKYAEDYRVSIVKNVRYAAVDLDGSWLNSRKNHRGRRTQAVEVFTLNFWCMNPAVGFSDFSCCRTVILTSGTLSPVDSFQSELGLPFPIVLEANHIIRDEQVWVGVIGQGPDGTSLQAVYRNMETFGFQDQLGQLILGICKAVPKGVLCFLPSYNALDKLTSRWKQTGIWEQFQHHKHVMSEPRGSDKVDFDQILRSFYKTVSEDDTSSSCDGALFFAVCRGKVSEGMDFADNFARAVITVGIPYPNFKDVQVDLKRKYNDRYQSSRRLLSGNLWYEIQAFRALNQALGRCIRHRCDWGALIIVDDRFVKNTQKYSSGLSKWVRQKLKVHHSCDSMLVSLQQFTHARLEQELKDRMKDPSAVVDKSHINDSDSSLWGVDSSATGVAQYAELGNEGPSAGGKPTSMLQVLSLNSTTVAPKSSWFVSTDGSQKQTVEAFGVGVQTKLAQSWRSNTKVAVNDQLSAQAAAQSPKIPVIPGVKSSLSFTIPKMPEVPEGRVSLSAVCSPMLFENSTSLTSPEKTDTSDLSLTVSLASAAAAVNQQEVVTSANTTADLKKTIATAATKCLTVKSAFESFEGIMTKHCRPLFLKKDTKIGLSNISNASCSSEVAVGTVCSPSETSKQLLNTAGAVEAYVSKSSSSLAKTVNLNGVRPVSPMNTENIRVNSRSQVAKRRAGELQENVDSGGVVRRLKTRRRSSTIRILRNTQKDILDDITQVNVT
ncbi:Fanconi anemia group J protein homolog isoform X2 [Pomacea canaliculata]|nr:Fanconi anemia group J protein homolog isoform X2 [Pomacea canaliculata]